ncbi:MAG: class II aldolase [Chloroflexi bacterium]|nr:class II aldolase [Chloroflexota bacterium]
MTTETLTALVEMTRTLGAPEREYVIIGEGNTSARIDDETFWVKASGRGMHGIDASGFVQTRFAPLLDALDQTDAAAMQEAMRTAKVDADAPTKPSIEASFHAMLLADCGANWIAHTHPVLVNQIMCSTRAEQFAKNRMFPDDVVLCGPELVFVPYADPGLPLALAIRMQVKAYMKKHGEAPKVILLGNHGLITLGQTPADALNITAMCVKAAGIFVGACAVGEPTFLSEADVMHIYKRPDEIYRRRMFAE